MGEPTAAVAATSERDVLLATKLTVPGSRPGLVPRPRLAQRLDEEVLERQPGRVREFLLDRVADVAEFLDALRRVAAGGTALDPEVVAQLLVRRGGDPLDNLTDRKRDVLALMAEGRSNAEIAATLVITDSAVSKHINSIFAKLGLYPHDAGHRRVLAVLRYLGVDPALCRGHLRGRQAWAAGAREAVFHDHEIVYRCIPYRGPQIHVSAPGLRHSAW